MGKDVLNKMHQAYRTQQKQLAVLIDPDTQDEGEHMEILKQVNEASVDYIFLGGSLLTRDVLEHTTKLIKKHTSVPVVIFPGSALQVTPKADAILFLSLISGRNPELLIGTHVVAAPVIKQAQLETLPTGYMLIDSGKPTTASYMSNSFPIPHHKPEIAACTAMAGEMLGLKLMYLDGGSGAEKCVSEEMLAQVRNSVATPIIVGGGIRDTATAEKLCKAGADIVVIGNATEENPQIIKEIAEAIHNL